MQHLSIKLRLSIAFYILLLLIIFFGIFNIFCLNNFHQATKQIRIRWLPNTRFLGEISNYTSDFRAFEGELLLTQNKMRFFLIKEEMDNLDKNIRKSCTGYEAIDHDNNEMILYKAFLEKWTSYREMVDHSIDLLQKNDKKNAVLIYKTTSQILYEEASNVLKTLTNLGISRNKTASENAARAYHEIYLFTSITMIIIALMVVFGVIYIRRCISEPMLDIAESMNKLAHNNMDIIIRGTQRQDEIGDMARALMVFRNNAINLISNQQGLAKEASMLEEKLNHERNLIEMQRNFISIASHEFRTPLNIIDGHTQRLAKIKTPIEPEEIIERTNKIRSFVKQMTNLIDNLINSSRLFESNPELYFHPTRINLKALLNDICDKYREILSHTQIIEKIDDDELNIFGDYTLLEQAFGNILSNAIKYSASGKIIEVKTIKNDGQIIVTIKDYGIGIPQKDIENIFKRYNRGSNINNISGTGIGLYLAQIAIKLHNGNITVASKENEGSIFTITIPDKLSIDRSNEIFLR